MQTVVLLVTVHVREEPDVRMPLDGGIMTAPVRVQQRRTKGWRKPENTVSVARPSKWGNPYRVGEPSGWEDGDGPILLDRSAAVIFFTEMVNADGIWDEARGVYLDSEAIRAELAGKNLMCFCPLDQPCHADVLLELANGADS